jgi:hypothetical protein
MFPFATKGWGRPLVDGTEPLPKDNPNLPELYTPIVFIVIFLLLTAVQRAVRGTFRLEQIGRLGLKLVGYLMAAVAGVKGFFFVVRMPGEYPWASLVGDLGTMSVYLTVITIASWWPSLRRPVTVYCAVVALFWTVRTLKPRSDIQFSQRGYTHEFSIFVVALLHATALVMFVR